MGGTASSDLGGGVTMCAAPLCLGETTVGGVAPDTGDVHAGPAGPGGAALGGVWLAWLGMEGVHGWPGTGDVAAGPVAATWLDTGGGAVGGRGGGAAGGLGGV